MLSVEVQEDLTRCLVSLGLAFSSAPMIVTWAFSCREPLAALGHQGWVGGNAYLKSGCEHSVKHPVEELPISTVWAGCTLLQPTMLCHPPLDAVWTESDVYGPLRDYAAHPVSELFTQGLRRQTFSVVQALQPCVVQNQAVCEWCERP